MRKLSSLIISLVCFAVSLAAVCPLVYGADTVAVNPVGDAVAGILTGVVFPVLSALLLGLVGVVLNKARQKFNLQISAEAQERLENLAYQGITYAEEKAAAAVKSGLTKVTGREKLDIAISHILGAVPSVSPEQAEKIVHSLLARVEGTGATGAAVK